MPSEREILANRWGYWDINGFPSREAENMTVRNKANLASRAYGAAGRVPRGTPCGVTTNRGDCAKQSQFKSGCGLGIADCGLCVPARRLALVRNKANPQREGGRPEAAD